MRSGAVTLIAVAMSLGCGGRSLVVVDAVSPPLDADSPPPAARAMICVVRPSNTEASTAHAVHDNGALVGATRGRGHFCYLAEPGAHSVRIDIGGANEQSSVEALGGRSYYLHEEVAEVMSMVVVKLLWLEQTDARPLLASTKYGVIGSTTNDEPVVAVAPKR